MSSGSSSGSTASHAPLTYLEAGLQEPLQVHADADGGDACDKEIVVEVREDAEDLGGLFSAWLGGLAWRGMEDD